MDISLLHLYFTISQYISQSPSKTIFPFSWITKSYKIIKKSTKIKQDIARWPVIRTNHYADVSLKCHGDKHKQDISTIYKKHYDNHTKLRFWFGSMITFFSRAKKILMLYKKNLLNLTKYYFKFIRYNQWFRNIWNCIYVY